MNSLQPEETRDGSCVVDFDLVWDDSPPVQGIGTYAGNMLAGQETRIPACVHPACVHPGCRQFDLLQHNTNMDDRHFWQPYYTQ